MLFTNIDYVDADYRVQRNAFIQVEGNAIVYIGGAEPAGYAGERISGQNKLALPGFFNTHCHAPMTMIRGYGEGLPLHDWLFDKMFPFEAKMGSEHMYYGALLGIAEMIASGIVAYNDMYYNITDIGRAVESSGIKANLSRGFAGDAGTRLADTEGYRDAQTLLEIIKKQGHDRLAYDAGLHAEYTSSEDFIRQTADYAKSGGYRLQVHRSETKKEHEEAKKRRNGRTPAKFFDDCGLFDGPVTAAHCVWVEEADLDILAARGVTVAHCPSSNLKLGSGVAPVLKMADKGIRVTIGTDGAASNNNLNGLEEINLASIVQKGFSQDPLAMNMETTLRMATKNGALSQGRADCGAIAVGNRADIILFDMDKPHLLPVFDSLANALYAAQASDICLTMVDGRVLYKDGEYLTMDIERVKHKAVELKEDVLRRL